jgi:hypothetical protein
MSRLLLPLSYGPASVPLEKKERATGFEPANVSLEG